MSFEKICIAFSFLFSVFFLSAQSAAPNTRNPFPDWNVKLSRTELLRRAVFVPLSEPPRRSEAVYARTFLYSPEKQEIQLWFSCEGIWRFVLNGKVEQPGELSGKRDPRIYRIPLQRGWNELLFRVAAFNARHGFILGVESGRQLTDSAVRRDDTPAAPVIDKPLSFVQTGSRITFTASEAAVYSFPIEHEFSKNLHIVFDDHFSWYSPVVKNPPKGRTVTEFRRLADPGPHVFDLPAGAKLLSARKSFRIIPPSSFQIGLNRVPCGNVKKPEAMKKFTESGPEGNSKFSENPAIWTAGKPSAARIGGRPFDTFCAPSRSAWGYAVPQNDSFIVLHPLAEKPGETYPLYVVLHSAGHNVFSSMECMRTKGNHDIYHSPDNFYALVLDCHANAKNDWWWGAACKLFQQKPHDLTPTEKRVMDTIAWVKASFPIDAERVYLSGNSMGGSGTLGIGLNHGDVFAAVKANVPAHVRHVGQRLYFGKRTPPAFWHIPDPPICIDYSAQNDGWSENHEEFYRGMVERKYPLIGYWGPFGHANNHEAIARSNDLIDSFDWLSIRLHDPYPVFTAASSDDPLPWPRIKLDKRVGQRNAWFRWRNVKDTPELFEMGLRIVSPRECRTRFAIPEKTKASVTPRRLQHFRVRPGARAAWKFGTQSGIVTADSNGLLTIPVLMIEREERILSLSKR